MLRPFLKVTSFLYGCLYTLVHSYHLLFPPKTFHYNVWRPRLTLRRLFSAFRAALSPKASARAKK